MGYDFRGGSINSGDRAFADYLQDVKTGQTRDQRNRDLQTRMITTGIQAGVGAVGNMVKGAQADEDHENALKKRFMEQNIKIAQRESGALNDQRAQVGAENNARGYADDSSAQANSESTDQMPDWLKAEGGEGTPGDAGKQASANLGLNQQAARVPLNGYATPQGMQETQDGAGALNRDMNMLQTWGGMAGSLPRY